MGFEDFIKKNTKCYDRFTFDNIFKYLLSEDFTHEEAKDYIIYNCSLSAIIFEERIENGFYKKININDSISEDLQLLKNKIFNTHFPKWNLN